MKLIGVCITTCMHNRITAISLSTAVILNATSGLSPYCCRTVLQWYTSMLRRGQKEGYNDWETTPQDYASANGFRISAQQTFGRPPRRQGVEARPQIGAAVPRIHPALPSARNSRARRFVSSLRRLLARGEVDRDFWWHGSGRRVAGRRGCQRADRRVHEW
jgi:hypothetical protein